MEERPRYRYIVDAQAAAEALAPLAAAAVVGFDTETYWDRDAKQNRATLVQVAPPGGEAVVVDVQATGVEVVRPLVESPAVVLAAHNARFDELVLLGAGLRPASFIDTLRLARTALALPSYSLAAVVEHLFGRPLDKSLQNSNWRRRPLTRAQLEYAATDAQVTLLVYEELRRRLEAAGKWAAAERGALLTGEPPQQRTRRRLKPKTPPPVLSAAEKRVVTRLKKWRLERAFAQRVPAYMVCSDRTLEELAHTRPDTLDALRSVYGLGESKITLFGDDLLAALRAAFTD
ncbi:MAG TPA: HRDC domain-containing protein [Pyrinomonadaceae bacterium]|jgi:ribonuclease D